VYLAHEILIREGRIEAAELWQRNLNSRTHERADHYMQQLDRLAKKHGMRLPAIAERLAERFTRPMVVARLRALAAPAIEAADNENDSPEFRALREEIEGSLGGSVGQGLEVPDWVLALEEEVSEVRRRKRHHQTSMSPLGYAEQVKLDLATVNEQLSAIRGE